MSKSNSIVAVYASHTEAEAAVKELQQSGFDMKKPSIVGRDHHTMSPELIRSSAAPLRRWLNNTNPRP
jgi:hypothetical protein